MLLSVQINCIIIFIIIKILFLHLIPAYFFCKILFYHENKRHHFPPTLRPSKQVNLRENTVSVLFNSNIVIHKLENKNRHGKE